MSLGFILAIFALLVGSFFFLYAMKYYLTLAMVLWFSRRSSRGYYSNGNGHNGTGNGNGYHNGHNGNGNGNGFNGNGHNGYNKYIGNGKNNGNIEIYNSKYLGDGNGNGSNISYRSGLMVHDENHNGNGSNGHSNGNGNGNGNGNNYHNGNGHQQESFFYRLFGRGLNGNGNGNHNGNGNGYHNGNGFNGHNGHNGHNGNGNGLGMIPDHEDVKFTKEPFVSIHLPFYNEKKVVNRILTACTSLNYKNYEVIVADDSTDETVAILEKWKGHPKVKISHRSTREGWKGGALQHALEKSDPRTDFVIIFDADFIPYPDTIWQFLKYFNVGVNVSGNGNGNGNGNGHNGYHNGNGNGNGYHANGYNGNGYQNGYNGNGNTIESGDFKNSNIAAVQGYQWHVLNKNENWITQRRENRICRFLRG